MTFNAQTLRNSFSFMRGNIVIFSITGLLGNFSRAMVFPYASLYILALGGSPEQVGIVNALAPLLGLIFFPIAGYLADHTGRVKIIAFSNFLSGVSVLLYVVAPDWRWIAFAMLLRGVVTLQFPARSAMIADSLSPEDRGRGVATMNTVYSALSMFAPYIAGLIVAQYGANMGIRALYAGMMILYLLSSFIMLRYLEETSPNAGKEIRWAEFPRVLLNTYSGVPAMMRQLPRSVRVLTIVLILNFMANGVASPFWVIYATEQIGLSPASWGFILLVEAALRNVLFIPGGLLVDRWGRTRTLLAAFIVGLIAMPAFVLVHGFVGVLIVRIAIALVHATAVPSSIALMADTVPRDMRGRVMAAIGQGGIMLGAAGGGTGGPGMGFLITIPLMLSSLLGGYLYGQNPIYPWIFVLATSVLSVMLTILFIRDPHTAEV